MAVIFIFFLGAFIKCCAVHTPSSNPKKPPARRLRETLQQPIHTLQRMVSSNTLLCFSSFVMPSVSFILRPFLFYSEVVEHRAATEVTEGTIIIIALASMEVQVRLIITAVIWATIELRLLTAEVNRSTQLNVSYSHRANFEILSRS